MKASGSQWHERFGDEGRLRMACDHYGSSAMAVGVSREVFWLSSGECWLSNGIRARRKAARCGIFAIFNISRRP